jgi:hypothetical protein
VKKLRTEEEIHARLRELTAAARKLRQELQESDKPRPRLRELANDRPLRRPTVAGERPPRHSRKKR